MSIFHLVSVLGLPFLVFGAWVGWHGLKHRKSRRRFDAESCVLLALGLLSGSRRCGHRCRDAGDRALDRGSGEDHQHHSEFPACFDQWGCRRAPTRNIRVTHLSRLR